MWVTQEEEYGEIFLFLETFYFVLGYKQLGLPRGASG